MENNQIDALNEIINFYKKLLIEKETLLKPLSSKEKRKIRKTYFRECRNPLKADTYYLRRLIMFRTYFLKTDYINALISLNELKYVADFRNPGVFYNTIHIIEDSICKLLVKCS